MATASSSISNAIAQISPKLDAAAEAHLKEGTFPPFLEPLTVCDNGSTQTVLLPTEDGGLPSAEDTGLAFSQTTISSWTWRCKRLKNNNLRFWTLSAGDQTHIVKAFKFEIKDSDTKQMKYLIAFHIWEGYSEQHPGGFGDTPQAFMFPGATELESFPSLTSEQLPLHHKHTSVKMRESHHSASTPQGKQLAQMKEAQKGLAAEMHQLNEAGCLGTDDELSHSSLSRGSVGGGSGPLFVESPVVIGGRDEMATENTETLAQTEHLTSNNASTTKPMAPSKLPRLRIDPTMSSTSSRDERKRNKDDASPALGDTERAHRSNAPFRLSETASPGLFHPVIDGLQHPQTPGTVQQAFFEAQKDVAKSELQHSPPASIISSVVRKTKCGHSCSSGSFQIKVRMDSKKQLAEIKGRQLAKAALGTPFVVDLGTSRANSAGSHEGPFRSKSISSASSGVLIDVSEEIAAKTKLQVIDQISQTAQYVPLHECLDCDSFFSRVADAACVELDSFNRIKVCFPGQTGIATAVRKGRPATWTGFLEDIKRTFRQTKAEYDEWRLVITLTVI